MQIKTIERDAGPQTAFANLRRGDGGPINPELIRPFPAGIDAKLEVVRPGELYRVHITLMPPWPNEPIRKFLRLKTGVEEAPYEQIRVVGAVVPRLRVVPKTFTLRPNSDGTFEQKSRLEWDRTATTKTVRLSVNDPNLSVSLEEENGVQLVVLRGAAGYKPSGFRPVVTLETDDPVVRKLVINVNLPKRRAAAKRTAIRRKAKVNAPTFKQSPAIVPTKKPSKG